MPRKGCGVCKSRDKNAINNYIVHGMPLREIARRYYFSDATIRRHKRNCVNFDLSSSVGGEPTKNDSPPTVEATVPVALKPKPKITPPATPIIGATNSSYIPSSYIDIHDIDSGIPRDNNIPAWIGYVRNYLVKFILKAERKGQDHLALLALKELRAVIETMIKSSELVLEQETHLETNELLQVITRALAPYRDASMAVSNELNLLKK